MIKVPQKYTPKPFFQIYFPLWELFSVGHDRLGNRPESDLKKNTRKG
jgi:hypothetical protein